MVKISGLESDNKYFILVRPQKGDPKKEDPKKAKKVKRPQKDLICNQRTIAIVFQIPL